MRDSLRQLALTRFREFVREPEALFWALLFPILLSLGLGLAFRNRPAELVHVGVVARQPADSAMLQALRASTAIAAESLDADAARLALRTGRIALLVLTTEAGAIVYEFDDTRPDARTARFPRTTRFSAAGGAPTRSLSPNARFGSAVRVTSTSWSPGSSGWG